MSKAYYNEIEPAAVHVLKALINKNIIAPGDIDNRSITEVKPDDIKGYTQCHFFAGGGIWSLAARMAGWPDERPIWSGSCPCQPFSVAGKGKGTSDERHLWPHFFRLIRACRPSVVVGEQVAGKAGYGWFDGVQSDLEEEGYTSRAVDIPACAVNAPHIRQRLYWVALADTESRGNMRQNQSSGVFSESSKCGEGNRNMGDTSIMFGNECQYNLSVSDESKQSVSKFRDANNFVGNNYWENSEYREGKDGKIRRAKPGVRLLVDGVFGRIHLLRIGGNAIVAPLAAEVIKALMD